MKKFLFRHYKRKSGTLVPFSLKKQIPFKTKRIFLVYGTKGYVRANHAHRKCSQYLIAITGKIEITYQNKNLNSKIILNCFHYSSSCGKVGILVSQELFSFGKSKSFFVQFFGHFFIH